MSADHVSVDAKSDERAASGAATCAAPSCWADGERVRVGGREAVLCVLHRKAFLGVSS
jgi:hypothetical protein